MEVMIAAMLLGLVALTASVIHTAAVSFLRQSSSNAKSQDEAAIIMERILRDIRRGYGYVILGGGSSIRIYTQEPTSNGFISTSPSIFYLWPTNGILYFVPSVGGTPQTVSTKIDNLHFSAVQDFTVTPPPVQNNRINIRVQLTAEVEGKSTSLDSTATLLYRPVQYPWEP